MNPYLFILLLYSGSLILIGLWLGRRVRAAGDFFVAGRRLGPGLIFATVLAANIGAGSTVGAAGLGFRDGLSAWWWVGSAGIGSILLAFWVGPRVRALAEEHGFYTVGDLLEYRYGRAARGAMASLLWLGTLAILAAQLVAVGVLLEVIIGFPQAAGVVIGGVVMTTYFAAGGLKGSAWINLIQLMVLLTAFLVTVPMALETVGGLGEFWTASSAVAPDFTDAWRGGSSGWILLPLIAPNFIVSPGLVQKVYGARDNRSVAVGVGLAAGLLFVFALAPALLGMVARMHYPEVAAAGFVDLEHAMPMLLRDHLPVAVGAVGLGAIFMAEVSSADAILFMLSTSASQDVYRRFLNPSATESQVLRVARGAAVAGGIAAMVIGVLAETVIGPMRIFYSLVAVMLFVPVIAGLYTGRAGPAEAFASFGGGIGVMLAVRFLTGGAGFGVASPSLLGLAASGLGFALVFVVRARRVRGAV